MTAPLMKGVDPVSRAFIALRYVNREKEDPNKREVVVVFHRYPKLDQLVNGTRYSRTCFTEGLMKKEYMECLNRLLRQEPCGTLKYTTKALISNETEKDPVRTLTDGRSIVKLV